MNDSDEPGRAGKALMSRTSVWLFFVFFLVVMGALTIPGLWFANREKPFFLGLPFFFFWVVLWVMISFVGQVVLYVMDPSNREEDA